MARQRERKSRLVDDHGAAARVPHFTTYARAPRLFDEDGTAILRPPQLAVARACLAHFTRSSAPAIGALPTGVGKTGTIAVLPYLLPSKRTLIVVPNRLLREQVAAEISGMVLFRRLGILDSAVPNPVVSIIEHEMRDAEAWSALEAADVVIATPYCISPGISGLCGAPKGFFDLHIFDEAHHTAAPVWAAILEASPEVHCAMLTATPYRRDRQSLPGILVYDYPMKRAIGEGYILPLSRQIVPFDAVGDPDRALALRIKALTSDEGSHHGVPFIVRTSSVDHASQLVSLYKEVGMDVGLILGKHSLRHAKRVVADFKNGSLSGLVIVGVLGEGFDFPDVKLAAYHRRHKSLAPTLQFFGRLARKSQRDVDAVILVPEHKVHDETAELYEESAEWLDLIPDLADNAITLERNESALRAAFGDLTDETVAPDALTPKRVVCVFNVPRGITPRLSRDVLPESQRDAAFQWFEPKADDQHFLVWLSAELTQPRWARRTQLQERILSFRAAVYVPEAHMIVIATDGASQAYALAETFGLVHPEPVDPERVQGYLQAAGVQNYYNVGMRSVEPPSNLRATYKTSAGPAIDADAILPAERDGYAFGHGTARLVSGNETQALGVAIRSGRFWSPESAASLSDFLKWCRELALGLHNAIRQDSAPMLDLRRQTRLEQFPNHPIFVELDPELFRRDARLVVNGVRVPLDLFETRIISASPTAMEVGLFHEDALVASVQILPNGQAHFSSSHVVRVPDSVDAVDGAALFTEFPCTIYYGDGSSTYGAILVPPGRFSLQFPATGIDALGWEGVDVSREVDGRNGLLSIHEYMAERLRDSYPNSLIINDDGRGEIADLLVIQRYLTQAVVRLYHCKFASGAGSNLQDLYEVLGQAQRSARWASNPRAFWKEAASRIDSRFRVVGGDENEGRSYLRACSSASPPTQFIITIVQPGIDATQMSSGDNVNVVLAMTDNVLRAHNASFRIIVADRPFPLHSTRKAGRRSMTSATNGRQLTGEI